MPVDQDVADKILSSKHAERLGKVEPLTLEGQRERFGRDISEEELLLRMTMPAELVDAIGTPAPPPPATEKAPSPACCARSRGGRTLLPAGGEGRGAGPVATVSFDGVEGIVFDMDGTLIHRRRGGGYETIPGAHEAIEAIRASGRKVFVFTNAGHVDPKGLSAELAEDGLQIAPPRSSRRSSARSPTSTSASRASRWRCSPTRSSGAGWPGRA